MRALVTGGAGFIGSTLVSALLEAGAEVSVVDDLSRGRREQVPPAAQFHQVDIVGEGLGQAVSTARPDVVFHLAAQIDVRRSVTDPVLDTRINVLGTVNLLATCVRMGVRRMVFASSGGALYGDTDELPTPEGHPCVPASAYGAAKLAGESYGNVFAQVHGLEFVALRFANVYGPRQDPHGEAGVVAIFAERLLDRRDAVINGDGGQTRDYVHVDDVVAANLRAAETDNLGAYNIGTGRECDVNELYSHIARAAGVDSPAAHGAAKPGEQRRSRLDITRAAALLDWHPRVPLEEGISDTVAWFAARRVGGE
ncbi:MAG: NAD-dependent epimerase/dehydratase family protein [Candidatus Dormibacteraeota bacterium]|uniref:NAD-dependent epimerase/dehydratase family protein n=1 Tax=Candidatus Amunia macphersoniae TaxID=3127014 RepID=A0A934KPM3_9BACT|nr:NAD-dependent epimerase/dehydratase family protein [Candidatus Dormibacteraeota bacterium]